MSTHRPCPWHLPGSMATRDNVFHPSQFLPLRPSRRRQSCAPVSRTNRACNRLIHGTYGYQCGSDLSLNRSVTTACCRQNLRSPAAPPLRPPIPEDFQPPIGKVSSMVAVSTLLMLTAPASSRRATRSARSLFPLNTLAANP